MVLFHSVKFFLCHILLVVLVGAERTNYSFGESFKGKKSQAKVGEEISNGIILYLFYYVELN